MSGISRRNFKMFRQLCGESTLKNVIIMTNMWGVVSEQIGREREAELAREDLFFKPTLDAGAQMLRHYNTHDSAHNILRYIVNNHPMPLQIQQEIVDEHKAITDTAAAEELQEELLKEQEKHRQEMLRVQQEMERKYASINARFQIGMTVFCRLHSVAGGRKQATHSAGGRKETTGTPSNRRAGATTSTRITIAKARDRKAATSRSGTSTMAGTTTGGAAP